jgi:hypothetical protein
LEFLTERHYFDEFEFRNESSLLLQDSFKSLSPSNQEKVLRWVEEGPTIEKFISSCERCEGEKPSRERIEHYRKSWQRDRLAPISADLPEKWGRRLDELVEELGPSESPRKISVRHGVWVGPTSPRTIQEIATLTVEEIVAYLKDWKPPSDWQSPTPEGLSRALTEVVREKPQKYASKAVAFQDLDATYVRALFVGLVEALQKDRQFEWRPVLQLSDWVARQPRAIDGRSANDRDADPHWGWARKAIANLLGEALQKDLSPEYRGEVWEIIERLTEDPDPTPEEEAQYGGGSMDPLSLSINTTRGEVFHAVVKYALWVRRYQQKQSDAEERIRRGFDEMPEVRGTLERHLDPKIDPSLAIRAVYGQWFPWLIVLDPSWATAHVAQIFPPGIHDRALWGAAWNTYIVSCQPYNNVLPVIRAEYARAIQRLGSDPSETSLMEQPEGRLAEHLVLYYARGILSLDEHDGLFPLFFSTASDEVRAHALTFVGRMSEATSEGIRPEILERFVSLWEARFALAVQNPKEHEKELAAFGWWFYSGKFSPLWSFEQLDGVLRLMGWIDDLSFVLDRVAILAPNHPRHAVKSLALLMDHPQEPWVPSASRTGFRTILTAALRSGDNVAANEAEALINKLAAAGHLEFRDLLTAKMPPLEEEEN